MSRLSRCLAKAKGLFTKEEEDYLRSVEEQNKESGDVEAASIAAVSLFDRLAERLDALKERAGVSVAAKKVEQEAKEKADKEKADKEAKAKQEKADKEKERAEAKQRKQNAKEAVKKIFSEIPQTFEEAVLRFFIAGGRISSSDFKRYTGFGQFNERKGKAKGRSEFNQYIGFIKNGVMPIDNRVQSLWSEDMNRGEDGFDETDLINQFFEILTSHSGKRSMLDRVIEIQKKQEVPAGMESYIKDLEEAEKFFNERELTEEEVNKFLEDDYLRDYLFAQEGQFQKKSKGEKANVQKVLDRMKKVAPKVNIVVDENLDAAGVVQGNTLKINPYYAGTDTPIHEIGHILIDALGFNNKVIQAGIKQLKNSPLWKEVAGRYEELNDEMLAKEVLAEAIGREGAGIFDTEVEKGKFKAVLEYIYTKLKQLLGIDKNVAKSLAKQIIAGVNTKELVGKSEDVQFAKKKVLTDAEQQVKDLVDAIAAEPDLSKYSYEDLLDAYNAIEEQSIPGKTKYLKDIKVRIAMNIFERQKAKLEGEKDFSADVAARKDITAKDVKFKVLSHFTNAFAELKGLSEMWDRAYFDKTKEAKEEKRTNEKLAIAVIKERNKKLGLVERGKEFIQQLFSNVNHKYFDYLDNGKGGMITLEQAKKKGLSNAQIEYLKYVRDLMSKRMELIGDEDIYNMDMEVLKLDKGFSEAFRTDGLAQAFGNWLTSNFGLRETEIEFTNPITGKTSITKYGDAENILIKYGQKGAAEKAKSLGLILKYNFAARRKAKDAENKTRGSYYLDENGNLQSKFDRKREATRPYSKDFYKAVSEYIDDNSHIKHISPLMPIIESIRYLNEKGVYEYDEDGNKVGIVHAKKPNVVKWMDEWTNMHVLRQKQEGIPELDAALKFLRFMTSATTMMFNVPAGLMNIAIGNYNAWRAENAETWAKGQKRLFLSGKRKFGKDYAFGMINPYALDIARKYGAVSTDIDSNPIQTVGGVLSELGHAMTKYGEFQIQASGLLGLMSDTDYNSFEYKKNAYGVDELVFKKDVTPEKQAEIEARILKHINQVSDVQGKYSDKDRRNIQNNELGKALMQFKVYLPDWWRIRYGDKGSWNTMLRGGIKSLKQDIKDKGLKKGFWDNESNEAKAIKSNIKELMVIGMFMVLSHSDEDDDEGKKAVKLTDKALSNLLGVFDPEQLKFTVTRPIAAMGTVEKFINAVEHLALWEESAYYKRDSKYGDKEDSKLQGDVMSLTPAGKIKDAADMFTEDDEE